MQEMRGEGRPLGILGVGVNQVCLEGSTDDSGYLLCVCVSPATGIQLSTQIHLTVGSSNSSVTEKKNTKVANVK